MHPEPVPSEIEYPPELPITSRVEEIKAAIDANQVVVIAGETGSGKSTQLPKICLDLGRGANGRIGHTQPRRLAARAVAERVAEELSTSVGSTVGYAVRFNDQVGKDTRIKLMTDGILLAEIQRDRLLRAYDTLIIDEAHERSLNIDFLLGYLKQLLPRRPDLRIIITSATIDTARFSEHFDDAPVIEVSGRTHPVEIRYRPLSGPNVTDGRDQSEGICDAVVELMREVSGDVLVFCSGEREIRDAADALAELNLPNTEIFPLFARLSSAEQHQVFRPHSKRRVVVATNVAETSLTVPGIRSVVDPGTARISRYNLRTKVQRLPIEPISQASANQRAGRCGRVAPGVCIRLYDEDDFVSRPEFTEPEIQRTNLSSVILQMAALGLGDIEAFPFVQPPDRRNIRDGVLVLEELGAVDPALVDTAQWLTDLGRRLARLPLDPRLGRMIIEAAEGGCLAEVLVIASGLSIQDPRERPTEKRQIADEFHKRFDDERSDFLSLLHLWDYVSDEKQQRSGNQFRRMCGKEFLNWSRLREWQDLHTQLRRVARDLGYRPNAKPASSDAIHLALLAGLLSQIGQIRPPEKGSDKRKRTPGREYLGARSSRFVLGRESMVAGTGAEWVMAAELVETNRMWARTVAPMDPAWAERLAGNLVTRSHDEPLWDPELASAVVRERVTLFGLPLVVGRRVQYVRVDPAAARALFIDTALIDGRWEATYAFIAHNQRVRAEVAQLEARTRRPDLSVDRSRLFAFFDQRLGPDVSNAKAFDRWWGRNVDEQPELLHLTVADAVVGDPDQIDADAFPDAWIIDGHSYRIFYELDPDSDADGLTVEIPVDRLATVTEQSFEWMVPGHRLELIASLLRGLPRQIRKAFVPVPDTAIAVVDELKPGHRSLRAELALVLTRRSGVTVEPTMFDLESLPEHLRPTFLLLDEAGEPFLESKDLAALRGAMDDRVRETLADGGHHLEREGLREWPDDEIPTAVETGAQGHRVKAYPALVDQETAVDLALLPSAEEQMEAHWSGIRRLVRFSMSAPVKQVDRMLSNRAKLAISADSRGRVGWYNDAITCALDALLEAHGAPVWNRADFERLVDACRPAFTDELRAIVGFVEQLVPMILGLEQDLNAVAVEASAADARAHLQRLTYPDFLAGVGAARLSDVVRYVQAIEYRVERINDGRRDATLMLQCRKIEAEYYAVVDRLGWSVEIEEVAWMIEEFRVSLFAQPIGTSGSISEKRIRRALSRLG